MKKIISILVLFTSFAAFSHGVERYEIEFIGQAYKLPKMIKNLVKNEVLQECGMNAMNKRLTVESDLLSTWDNEEDYEIKISGDKINVTMKVNYDPRYAGGDVDIKEFSPENCK